MQKINTNQLPQGKHKVLKASVSLTGIKKRCRRADRHIEYLGYFSTDTKIEELKPLAEKVLKENFKLVSNNKGILSLHDHELEVIENDILIQRMTIDSNYFNCPKLEVTI